MMAGGAATPPHINANDKLIHMDERVCVPHSDPDMFIQDAYRCPVSTPAYSGRPPRWQQGEQPVFTRNELPDDQMYVAFSKRCQRASRNGANGKLTYRRSFNDRYSADETRSKDRHYYFIARLQPSSNVVESPVRSKWLNTLCSQPVEEIFVKYKRRLEANLVPEAWSSRDVSTPGEKALVSAWSCNSSTRSQSCTPSFRSPTPVHDATSPVSRMSTHSSLRAYGGYESDSSKRLRKPEFSLVPVVSSATLLHKVNPSPRSSVSSIKTNIVPNDTKTKIKPNKDTYDKFKREPRRQKLLPRRQQMYKLDEKDTNSEEESNVTEAEPTQTQNNNDLEQSQFEIVSFGASSQELTKKPNAQAAPNCCFCLKHRKQNMLQDISAKG